MRRPWYPAGVGEVSGPAMLPAHSRDPRAMPHLRFQAALQRSAALLLVTSAFAGASPASAFGYVVEGPIYLEQSTSSNRIATGDFDGDGAADVAYCYGGTRALVYSQAANGQLVRSFEGPLVAAYEPKPGYSYVYTVHACRITAVDLNQDGLDDLVISHSQGMLQLLARGDRSFVRDERVDYQTVSSHAAIDVDGDGILDIVLHRRGNPGSLRYIQRRADGLLGAEWPFKTLDTTDPDSDLAVGDLDSDGRPDLAFVSHTWTDTRQANLQVFLQPETGNFASQPKLAYPAGAVIDHARIGDVTGDGRPDLVVTASVGSAILVHAQTAGGQLAAWVGYGAYAAPMSFALEDMDNDGLRDLVVNNVGSYVGSPGGTGWPGMSTYFQRSGALVFDHQVTQLANNGNEEPNALAVADFDADGCRDALLAASGAYYRFNAYGCAATPTRDLAVTLDALDWRSIATVHNTGALVASGVARIHLISGARVVEPSYVPPECTRMPTVGPSASFACLFSNLAPGASLPLQFNYASKRALDEHLRIVASVDEAGRDPDVADNRAAATIAPRVRPTRAALPRAPLRPLRDARTPAPSRR
jgi:hypothetical protein